MKKYEIIKEHKEFDDIIATGLYKKGKYCIIYNKERKTKNSRFGIAVGKKVGNAVIRNKLKRQYRMIVSSNKNLFSNDKDYIIIVKKASNESSFTEKEQDVLNLI